MKSNTQEPKEVELFVSLKIPDTTAVTAMQTMRKMGYNVSRVKRINYYKFYIGDNKEEFENKIKKIDVLVNVNKHKASTKLERDESAIYLLIKDIGDNCSNLTAVLRDRLNLKELKRMERGVIWALYIDSGNKEEIAKRIGKELLCNENYQEIKVF